MRESNVRLSYTGSENITKETEICNNDKINKYLVTLNNSNFLQNVIRCK